jgi:hypothetical protein
VIGRRLKFKEACGKGEGRDRRCGFEIFPAALIWLFQRKHVADFSELKKCKTEK